MEKNAAITMDMAITIIKYSMSMYGNSLRLIFGYYGMHMHTEKLAAEIVAAKNELHDMFRQLDNMNVLGSINVQELSAIIHDQYGWLGTSYMEVSLTRDPDGLLFTFEYPTWNTIMKQLVRNLLHIGRISPYDERPYYLDKVCDPDNIIRKSEHVSDVIREGGILTGIRSSHVNFLGDPVGDWWYETTVQPHRLHEGTREGITIQDILELREVSQFIQLRAKAIDRVGPKIIRKRNRKIEVNDAECDQKFWRDFC